MKELKLEGLYKQRTILNQLIQSNKITNDVATQIRENINYNEMFYLTNQMNKVYDLKLNSTFYNNEYKRGSERMLTTSF